jgi:hypothetical protein
MIDLKEIFTKNIGFDAIFFPRFPCAAGKNEGALVPARPTEGC